MELGLKHKETGSEEEKSERFEKIRGEAAFYGPKLDFEVQAADGKNITIATIQLDFVMPQKFGLNYIDRGQEKKPPVIIHQSPFGSYQRFIALLLEQTDGKLPFWLVPCQVAILPINEEKEIKDYCEKLVRELEKIDLRAKIFSKKKWQSYIPQIYQKKIPYYLVIGEEELEKKKLKLINAYQEGKEEELTEEELYNKLREENKI